MDSDLILVIVVVTALAFDFTNGFHDTANVVATSISTRAMPPRLAVGCAAMLNFVGAFLSLQVAATIAKGIVDAGAITPTIVFAGLVGAISWNLITWYFGLPSSSSHALIGGVVGATLVAAGRGRGDRRRPRLEGADPGLDRAGARVRRRGARDPRRLPDRRPAPARPGQPRLPPRPDRLGRAARARARHQRRAEDDGRDHAGAGRERQHLGDRLPRAHLGRDPSATAIALGTYSGGWRIIRTMGTRIIKMDPAQGFSAQTAGATVILAASHFGYPLSTTHVISGGVMGAGAAKRLSAVRWGVAGNIVAAWVLTLPAARRDRRRGLRAHADLRHRRARPGGHLGRDPVAGRGRVRAPRAARPRGQPHGGLDVVTLATKLIDTNALLNVVWVSLVAAVGGTAAFSLAIVGATRFADMRRAGRAWRPGCSRWSAPGSRSLGASRSGSTRS